jgi:hypothetical protein
MMYLSHLTESVGLEVEKPMILEMDNKGAVDKHWSSVLKAHAKTKSAGVSAMSFLFTSYSCCMPTLNHIVVLNLLGSKKGIIPSK